MSEGNKYEINNAVSGGAQQQNIGQSGGHAEMNVDQSQGPSFSQFMVELEASISKEVPPEQLATIQREIIKPLREAGESEEPTSEQDRITLQARIGAAIAKLEPYVPYIRRTLAAFAEGALLTIPPPASWVVGGVIEVVRDARNR